MMSLSVSHLVISLPVQVALSHSGPVVALESAVLTHGLPHPRNIEAVERMWAEIERAGATPALCLITGGCLHVGASLAMAEAAAQDIAREKASVRELGSAIARGITAGLTVSATLFAANRAGIRAFATGGIGGVHRDFAASGDISADLHQLARTPVITVCSGAKSVLDIPRTLEQLETLGVPVFGYGTATFPAFYLADSGVAAPRVDSAGEIVAAARSQWELGYSSGILVGNPIPPEAALSPAQWRTWLAVAEAAARQEGIRGKEVTPFLLDRVAAASDGRTVTANLALLEANARLAAEIAVQLSS